MQHQIETESVEIQKDLKHHLFIRVTINQTATAPSSSPLFGGWLSSFPGAGSSGVILKIKAKADAGQGRAGQGGPGQRHKVFRREI